MQQSLFPELIPNEKPAAGLINRADLNKAQLAAVTSADGPVLVIAGAGSGKTRTLVYRMAYLLEKGVAPESILLLTFTRKSAQEMLARATRLVDESCQRVVGGTFHSVANLLLRRYGHHLGFAANFTILDRSDSEGIVNIIKSSLELGGAGKKFPSKRMIINILGKAVNKNVEVAEVIEEHFSHLSDFLVDIERIRDDYRNFKFEHGLMDYDDLLVKLRDVLADFEPVREEVAARFKYILVDEYQDTNPVQAEIVKLIAYPKNNIMVVGDDAQSIYSFRGADFRNIMEFPQLFKGTQKITLEENYRSSQNILTATNAIISNAAEKYTKNLFSNISEGDKPVVYGARDEGGQARFVANKIIELHGTGIPYAQMAVLFRSSFHSYKLELELANNLIEFEKRGGLKLTESAHIKDVITHLRLLTNPHDNLSWNRILLMLEKVGPKTARNMLDKIKAAEDPIQVLASYPAGKSWQKGLRDLVGALKNLTNPALTPVQQFDMLMEYYRPVFERIYHDDFPRRSKDLEQLQSIIAGYDSLQAFIDDTALDPPESLLDEEADRSDKLILSTVHSAKGLEWDAVFVIHLTEGKFPSGQAFSAEEREEERRLLYVAATRARRHLFFTYPREIMGFDRKKTWGGISSFLEEIPPNCLGTSFGQMASAPNAEPVSPPLPSKAKTDTDSFSEGARVIHPFFGEGRVEKIVGARTLDIYFPRYGKKTLHLDYAKLTLA